MRAEDEFYVRTRTPSWRRVRGVVVAGFVALALVTVDLSAGALGPPPPPPKREPTELEPLDSEPPPEEQSSTPEGDFSNPPSRTGSSFDPERSTVVERDERSTTYENPDGSKTTRFFTGAENYRNDSGEWREIDSTVVSDGQGGYKNSAGPVRFEFDNSTDQAEPVHIGGNGWSVSFGLEGAARQREARKEQESSSRVTYDNVEADTDLEYEVAKTSLKEHIVLRSRPERANPRYRFPVTMSGVTAAESNGGITFTDSSGEVVVRVPEGLMWDSNATETEKTVDISLVTERAKSFIEIVPDAAWLSDPARTYPVYIDPTFQFGPVEDTYVSTADLDYSGYANPENKLGTALDGHERHTYHRFDVSDLEGTTITQALWSAYIIRNQDNAAKQYVLKPVSSAWDQYTINWNDQPNVRTTSKTDTAAAEVRRNVDITGWVDNWVNGTWQNYGIRAHAANNTDTFKAIASSDHATSSWRPYLEVTYSGGAPVKAVSPDVDALLFTTTPHLEVEPVANSSPIEYWFRIQAGFDGEAPGQIIESGWRSTDSWEVPEGALQDGTTYNWTVYTKDGSGAQWNAPWMNTFTTDLKLGDPISPSDGIGPVSVDLVTGNAAVSTGSRALPTVSGGIGVSYAYNSTAAVIHGLKGEYFDDADNQEDFDASEYRITRTDSEINFSWLDESPYLFSIPTQHWLARWTGSVTVPQTGNWTFGAASGDGVRITINNTLVVDRWFNQNYGAINYGTPIALTAGTPVAIKVEYYDNTASDAAIMLAAKAPGSSVGTVVLSQWLTPDSPELSNGWVLNTGAGGVSYLKAMATDRAVTLVGPWGDTHQYKRKGTGFTPPKGEDGVLSADSATGKLTLHETGGMVYVFGSDGTLESAVSSIDVNAPASPQFTWSTPSGSPGPRVTKVTDPVSARDVTLTHAGGSCPTPPGGFDVFSATSLAGKVCKISYWDGPETKFFYVSGQLARIEEPGGAITDFAYADGRMTEIRDSLAADAIAAGVRTDDATTRTIINYDAGRVSSVEEPAPTAGAARPKHTYTYVDATTTDVDVAGFGDTNDRRVVFDAYARTTSETGPDGLSQTFVWDDFDQLLSSTDPAGRKSTAIYDERFRPTDSYGPYAASAFGADNKPTSSYASVVPHATTTYDEGIKSLAASYWTNTTMTGAPKCYETGVGDASGRLFKDWGSGGPSCLSPTVDNWSARYTGEIFLQSQGDYTFKIWADGGARLYIDGQEVVNSWADNANWKPDGTFTTGPPNSWHQISIEYREVTLNARLELHWITPAYDPPVPVPGDYLSPRYGLATGATSEDAQAGTLRTATSYGTTPHLGLPTATTQDPNGLALTTQMSFETGTNGYNRPVSRVLPAGNAWAYAYYGDEETLATPPCGIPTTAKQAGFPKSRTGPDPDLTGPQTARMEEFAYDATGRAVASRINGQTWACTSFDTRGRVLSQTIPAFGDQPSDRTLTSNYAVGGNPLISSLSDDSLPVANRTITTTIDLLGRAVSSTDVWGNTTTSTYNHAGQLTDTAGPGGAHHFDYDASGRAIAQKLDDQTIAVPSYNASGEVTSVSYPSGSGNGGNGTSLNPISRDDAGRIIGLNWKQAGGALLTSDLVTRSQSGRVIDQSVDGTDPRPSAANFTYDPVGRLTAAWVPGRSVTYGFAGSGGCGALTTAGKNTNRTSTSINGGAATSYCYDYADKLTSTTDARYSSLSYDSRGNTTTLGDELMDYDAADRHMTTTKGSETVTYTRDVTDRIVSRTAAHTSSVDFKGSTTADNVSTVGFRGASSADNVSTVGFRGASSADNVSTVGFRGASSADNVSTVGFRGASSADNVSTVGFRGASSADNVSTVVFRAATSANNGASGGPTLTLSLPSGVQSGDVMLLHVAASGGDAVDITPPSGWSLVDDTANAAFVRGAVFVRVIEAVEPSTHTVSFSAEVTASGGIAAWSGVDAADPVVGSTKATAAAASSVSVPAVTAAARGRAVGLFALQGAPVSPPAGMTERWESSTPTVPDSAKATSEMADEQTFSYGSTGTRTAATPSLGNWVGHLVGLRPSIKTTLTLSRPATAQEGDVMLLHASAAGGSGTTITPPAGWALIEDTSNASSVRGVVYRKVVGSSEPLEFAVTLSAAVPTAGGIGAWSGVDASDPIEDYAEATATASTSVTVGAITASARSRIVSFSALLGAGVTPPSGMTERADISTAMISTAPRSTSEIADEPRTTSGSTGSRTATTANASSWASHLVALRPAGAATLTLSKPPGVAEGDAMLMHATVDAGAATITPPSGWAVVRETANGTSMRSAVYRKVAGASEPTAYTVSFSSVGHAAGGIGAWSGVDTTNPVEDSSEATATGATSVTAGGLTASKWGRLVGLFSFNGSGITPPTGMNERWEATTPSIDNVQSTSEMADEQSLTSGSTGPRTANSSSSGKWVGHLVALRPRAVTLELSRPAGTAQGDVMLMHATVDAGAATITPPSGWAVVRETANGTSMRSAVYRKVAGASEPSTYAVSFSSAGHAAGGIGAWSGVDQTNPVEDSSEATAANATSVTSAAITASAWGRVVGLVAFSGLGITPPSGTTERWEEATTPNAGIQSTSEMSEEQRTITGSTGTRIASSSSSGSWVGHLVALRPSVVTLVLPRPAGVTESDVMLLHATVDVGGASITPPSGWTLVRDTANGSAIRAVIYRKIAGASEPTTFTVSLSSAGHAAGGIGAWSGADPTDPILSSSEATATNATSVAAASVTGSERGRLIGLFALIGAEVTPPTGMTEWWDAATPSGSVRSTSEMADQGLTSSGSTGTRTANSSGSSTWVGHLVALRPAGAASLTLARPSGIIEGDAMLLHAALDEGAANITTPSGWTVVRSTVNGSAMRAAVYRKIAGASEPASYTLSFSEPVHASGGIGAWSGVHQSDPIEDSSEATATAATSVTVAGVMASKWGRVVGLFAFDGLGVTPPTGMTEQWEASTPSIDGVRSTSESSEERSVAAGSTGTRTATSSNSGAWVGQLVALRPPAVSLVLARPVGTAEGDVMLMHAGVDSGEATITPPSGWSLVRETANGTNQRAAVYRRVAGGSEPPSYTVSFSTAGHVAGGIGAWSGIDPADPVEGSSEITATNTTSVAASSVPASERGRLVGLFVLLGAGITPHSGMTERWEATTPSVAGVRLTSEMADEALTSSGSTGSRTATTGSSGAWAGHLVSLRPTGASTLTLARPAGVAEGDGMLLHAALDDGAATITPPSGWTVVRNTANGTAMRGAVYRKVAGSSEPATYAVSLSDPVHASGGIGAWSGVHPTDSVQDSSEATTTASTSVTMGSVSASSRGVVVAFAALKGSNVTPSSGMIERWEKTTPSIDGVQSTSEMADETRTSNGSTGTRTVTSASAGSWVGHLVALRPAVTTTAVRYGYSGGGDSASFVTDAAGTVIERTIGLPGGVMATKRASGDVWSYPNIHSDVVATANSSGVKQGATRNYDPYGEALGGVPDNSAGNFDYGWLGQYQRGVETEGDIGTIEMGARPYVPGLGRFLEVDPVEGGSANDYEYTAGDPVQGLDLAGTWSVNWSNVRYTFFHYIEKGLTKRQAAAIAGNLIWESRGLNPRDEQCGGPKCGVGIAHWTRSERWSKKVVPYANYVGMSPWSLRLQVGFLWAEFTCCKYKYGWHYFKEARSLEEATRIFMKYYEICNPEKCHLQERIYYAKLVLNRLG